MTDRSLENADPRLLWEHFLAVTRIPRPPKQEEEARAYVLAWAAGRGFETAVDDAGNAVVRVPASAGRESAPTVVLQAHLDMVCERDPDSPNDPRAGRIEVVRDGDWLTAVGTTLGADNGIGVAGALAAGEDPEIAHGPLELLFTVSEEQGLDGAKELDPALVSGRVLLNLDGTSDDGFTVGCAGSTHTFTRFDLRREALPAGHTVLIGVLSGARGGHSGGDIHRGRVNAIKALAWILSRAHAAVPLRLATLDGGVSRNAIPREARAVVAVPAEAEEKLRDAAEVELAVLREQYSDSDGGITLSFERGETAEAATVTTSRTLLDLLAATPTGVVAMSTRFPGAVETSTSLNVVGTEDGAVTLASMTRSANAPALEEVVGGIEAIARLAGAEVDLARSYPPWRPNVDSPLLRTACATFSRLNGLEPVLEVVHGGLECAVIGTRLPGVQMISLGPIVENPHAPGERVGISSTERFYRLLGALLDDLSGESL